MWPQAGMPGAQPSEEAERTPAPRGLRGAHTLIRTVSRTGGAQAPGCKFMAPARCRLDAGLGLGCWGEHRPLGSSHGRRARGLRGFWSWQLSGRTAWWEWVVQPFLGSTVLRWDNLLPGERGSPGQGGLASVSKAGPVP